MRCTQWSRDSQSLKVLWPLCPQVITHMEVRPSGKTMQSWARSATMSNDPSYLSVPEWKLAGHRCLPRPIVGLSSSYSYSHFQKLDGNARNSNVKWLTYDLYDQVWIFCASFALCIVLQHLLLINSWGQAKCFITDSEEELFAVTKDAQSDQYQQNAVNHSTVFTWRGFHWVTWIFAIFRPYQHISYTK